MVSRKLSLTGAQLIGRPTDHTQIYRKAALKIVQDLGEDAFPETRALPAAPTDEQGEPKTVEAQDAPEASTPQADKPEERKAVTTEQRKPFDVPTSVHVRITPENLKDYVGPPIYHKDRMYIRPPPPGVSTGLGYLGNGSGAVMPVEATVRFFLLPPSSSIDG